MPRKKIDYCKLSIVPAIIANVVLGEVYTGVEMSLRNRDFNQVQKVEAKRQTLTPEQRSEFADLVEKRCKNAYDADADWMLRIARSKTNRGRDELYMWVRHWLASYCLNPQLITESQPQ